MQCHAQSSSTAKVGCDHRKEMAAGREFGVLFLQIIVLLLALKAAGGDQVNSNHSSIDLDEFLHHARNGSLIDEITSKRLQQLAANLTGSMHPARLKLPSQEAYSEKDSLTASEEGLSGETNFLMKFYNQLTLLNILYFGGALLVMGAYTLFMTMAYERCNYVGLSGIMLTQVAVFGVAGIVMWLNNDEFQFVGGL